MIHREASAPRVCAGLIHVNEPTVDAARRGILRQEGVDVSLFEIAGRPQVEAHAALYRELDVRSDEVDAAVKVDGDMVIVEPRLFAAAVSLLESFPSVGVLSIGVDDWFSGERIDGMVIWRGGTRWLDGPQAWRPDKVTTSAQHLERIVQFDRPMVLHGHNPTPHQAARYGLHRGMKAVRTGSPKRIEEVRALARYAATDPHPRRMLALAGALRGMRRPDEAVRLMNHADLGSTLSELERSAAGPRLLAQVQRATRQAERRNGLRPSREGVRFARLANGRRESSSCSASGDATDHGNRGLAGASPYELHFRTALRG